ncbi:MAG: cellulase family glycosylhydrolase, partial [Mucilaginibacter sp.]
MMKKKIGTAYLIAGIFVALVAIVSCKKNNVNPPILTISNVTDTIPMDGGSVNLPAFTSNGAWSIDTAGFTWLNLSQTSGGSNASAITLTAPINKSGVRRTLILTVNSTNGQSRRITVLQDARIFPTYNTSAIAPDATGMSSTASQIAANITMGWNFYNTLEAPGSETGSWGNPPITQQQVDLVKSTGINAIRLPINYDGHVINTATAQIDPVWLARIKAIVQYCINDNMYVTVNIHYDIGGETGAQQDITDARHRAYWEQIATTLRNFDEHLMFASANEPAASTFDQTVTLMRYHQSFINAVRSTGGKNTYRTLVIQAPSVSIDLANAYLDPTNAYKTPKLPTDPTPHKMMLEFHYYTPSQFCILSEDASWGKELFFWGKDFHTTNPKFLDRNCGTWSEEHYADSILHTVKARFADKGIPLFIGEFMSNEHAQRLTGYPADSLLCLRSEGHYDAYIAEKAK